MQADLSTPWPTLPRDQLADALASFTARRGVALYGEAGVGKSHLAHEVRVALDKSEPGSREWFSVIGSHAESGIPLSAVDGLLAGVDVASLRTPRHIARLVQDHLTAHSCGRRVTVAVDDAHLLDDASAELLANLCRLDGADLLVTIRSGRRPVAPLVDLWRDDLVARVDIPPFTADEVHDVLWAALGGPVDSELVREVIRSTDGNAMYVRELVRAGLADHSIVQRHGTWIREGKAGPNARLVDLISAELGRLSAPERQAVELIALAEPVSVALARPLVDDAVLDQLVDGGIARIEDGLTSSRLSTPVLRLSHPIYAECVRSMITPSRRHALHHALYGEATSSTQQTLSGFLRWTAWTLECGLDIEASDLVRAARAASTLGQYEFAISVATAAIDRTSDTSTAVEALAIRARELRFRDHPVQALRDVDAALFLLRETPTSLDESTADRILAIHELRADLEQYGFDQPQRALETIDRVYGPLVGRGDRTEHAQRHRMSRIARRGWAGDLRAPLSVADELASRVPSSSAWHLQAVAPTMLALTWAGRSAEATALASRYLPAAATHDARMPRVGTEIYLVTFFVHLLTGRLAEARSKGPDPRTTTGTTRFDSALTYAGAARLLAAEGRWQEADEKYRIARRLFEVRDPSGFFAWSLAGEAFSAMMVGDHDRARELCLRVDRTPMRGSRAFEADIRAHVIGTLIGLKDHEAVGRATSMALWAQEHEFPFVELWALDLVALADPEVARESGVAARVEELSPLVDAPVAAPLVAHISAILAGDTALEDASAAQLGRLGRWVPRRPVVSASLSKREAEVASLVAAGLTSPAIAERLHLSARTVETHVARVFTKLGVNRRSQLADALRQHSA